MENVIDMLPAKNGVPILEWVITCHLWRKEGLRVSQHYRQSSLCMVMQDCQDEHASQKHAR